MLLLNIMACRQHACYIYIHIRINIIYIYEIYTNGFITSTIMILQLSLSHSQRLIYFATKSLNAFLDKRRMFIKHISMWYSMLHLSIAALASPLNSIFLWESEKVHLTQQGAREDRWLRETMSRQPNLNTCKTDRQICMVLKSYIIFTWTWEIQILRNEAPVQNGFLSVWRLECLESTDPSEF